MDSLSRILFGLSFIVHASVDEVDARVIPNNIQNRFESYDNFFVGGNAIKSQTKSDVDPAEPGRKTIYHLSTQLPPTSKFPKKDDFSFVDNDIIDLYHNVDNEYKDFSDNDSDIKGEDDAEKNWNISIYTDNKGNISIKTIPLQITTQGYISKRSVPNTDDEDLNFFGSGSGSGDGRNAILSPTKRDFKNDNNVNNKKTTRDLISLENKLNSSISDNGTVHGNYRKHQNLANAPRKALNINSSSTDDDDLVISGSGDERNEDAHDNMTSRSSNSNSIFKVTSSTSNKSIRTEDNPVVESNIKNREATKSSENNLSEIITQMPTVETNFFNSDDEDYEFSGSGDDNRDENLVNSKEFFTDKEVHFYVNSIPTVENTIKQIEAKHSSKANSFESTTQLFVSKQFHSITNDEDYKLFGSGGNINEDEDSLDSITKDQVEFNLNDINTLTIPIRTVTIHIYHDESKDNEERNLANTSEITNEMHITRFVTLDSDDEDYDFSGSGDENSGDENSELFVIETFVANNDDEDYEFSGSGEDANSSDSITDNTAEFNFQYNSSPPTMVSDFEGSHENISSRRNKSGTTYYETTNSLGSNLCRITNEKHILKNVVSNSDNEDEELSGSGDDDDDEYDISVTIDKEKFYVQNTAETTTPYTTTGLAKFSRTVSIESASKNKNNKATKSSVDNSTDLTTKMYVIKTFAANNDDEDYEFSGSGDDAKSLDSITGNIAEFNFQYNSSPSTIVSDFGGSSENISSSRNKSGTTYYETTTSLGSNSFRITNEKKILKNVVSNSDNEDEELSGSGDDDDDDDDDEYDISVTGDKEKFYVQNTADTTTTTPYITTGLAKFSRTVFIESASNNKNDKATKYSVDNSTDLTTKMYVIKTFAANNDDEDYEFTGSGDDDNSLDSITGNTTKFNFQYNSSPPNIFTDFEGSFQNISSSLNTSGTKYYETTNSLGSNSSRITNEKQILNNVISNSDNEDDELSGSGDDDDDEYDIYVTNDKEKFYVPNTADTTTTTTIPYITTGLSTFLRTVSIGSTINNRNNKATNSSVDNSTDSTTKIYVIKTFVANNDDEDYEFSGSGDDANYLDYIKGNTAKFNFQHNSSPPTIVTDLEGSFQNISSSHNKSDTKYYETINSLGFNSSGITIIKKQILKNVISNSDNEDDELSGSDDDEYDISGSGDEN